MSLENSFAKIWKIKLTDEEIASNGNVMGGAWKTPNGRILGNKTTEVVPEGSEKLITLGWHRTDPENAIRCPVCDDLFNIICHSVYDPKPLIYQIKERMAARFWRLRRFLEEIKWKKEKKVKKTYKVTGYDGISEHARFFDESCPDFSKDPEYNKMFLKAQERYANDLLRVNGHLFLNDVYKMLGMQPSKAGQVMGWIYDGDSKNPVFNNYVDFGIEDVYKEANRRFVNGHERAVLLDFNIDGNVWETM